MTTETRSQEAMHRMAIRAIRYLDSTLIGRSLEVRLVLLAALARRHSLLIGPPGTAKSQLASSLVDVFQIPSAVGSVKPHFFKILMMRFSKPDEVFGPLDIQKLLKSEYSRKTHRYLPEAAIAFLDEIFKSNSAILNSLLSILNEAEYRNGIETIDLRGFLITIVGASNELPRPSSADSASDALSALYDRFLIRLWTENLPLDDFQLLFDQYAVTRRGNSSPLIDHGKPLNDAEKFTFGDLNEAKRRSRSVAFPSIVRGTLLKLREEIRKHGEDAAANPSVNRDRPSLYVSDRRWGWIIELLQIAAWYDNREFVSYMDLCLLPYALACHQDDIRLIRNLIFDFAALFDDEDARIAKEQLEKAARNLAAFKQGNDPLATPITMLRKQIEESIGLCHVLQEIAILESNPTHPLPNSIWLTSEATATVATDVTQNRAFHDRVSAILNEAEAWLPQGREFIQQWRLNNRQGKVQHQAFEVPKQLADCGIRCSFIDPPLKKSTTTWLDNPIQNGFAISQTVVTRRAWALLRDLPVMNTHPTAAQLSTVEEIERFLTAVNKRIAPTCVRLPTLDEWRWLLELTADGKTPEQFIEYINPMALNCRDGRKSSIDAPCDDERFRHSNEYNLYSLLGNSHQLVTCGNGIKLVGGDHLMSARDCAETIINPREPTDELISFRIVVC